MHLSVIKLAQIPLRGATQLLGVRCIFEIGSKELACLYTNSIVKAVI